MNNKNIKSLKEENVIAYHGSPYDNIVSNKFKKGKHGYLGPSIYFSEIKDYAIKYAKKLSGNGTLYKVQLNINNPIILYSNNPTKELLTILYNTEKIYNYRKTKQLNDSYIINNNDIKKLLNKGFDAVIWNFNNEKEYAIYNNDAINIIDKFNV